MERDEIAARLAGLSPAKRALLDRRRRGEAAAPRTDVLVRRAGAGPAPLSFSQQRLWLLDQLDPGTPAYNLRILLQLTGTVDRRALARSFAAMVARHHVLRSAHTVADGAPVQVVLPHLDLPLPAIDLAALPPPRRQGEALRQARLLAGLGFDLARPPLLRTISMVCGDSLDLLLVVLHHAVADGWSFDVVLRELTALYTAFTQGLPSPLAELPLQYADFAVWQRQQFTDGALAGELAHWRRQLAGAPPATELPTDRPHPARPSGRGASRAFALPPQAAAAAAELARRQAATPFMVLLATLQALLLRYTGEEDLVVGSPVAGRNRPEVAGLIGFFVNTLALRGDLAGDPAFQELLARARDTVLDAFAHQDLPFERLVEELHPQRDPGRHPIFQVMLAFQHAPAGDVQLPGLALRQVEIESGSAMFELSWSLRQRQDGLVGTVEYSTDLFDATTAERWIAHFERLLVGGLEDPQRRLSEIPLLSAAEAEALTRCNQSAVPFGDAACLHDMFAAQAAAHGDTPAVVFQDRVLTYGELDRRSGLLARHLQNLGVAADVPVGLCVGRSLDLAVGILGVLKAGGAYVPLDETHPPERLAMMLADARCPVLLTQAQLAERWPPQQAVVLRLDGDWDAIAHAGAAATAAAGGAGRAPVTAANLAYVIYTSGSTGRPKGVACSHAGVVNIMADLERRWQVGAGDGCAMWTGASFDVAVWEIFSALCHGGTLHIPAESERTTAAALFPWMVRHAIRSLYLPGFLLAAYARWVGAGDASRRQLARLLVGVEPIAERLLADLLAAVPGLRIVNGYGPTEATVCATFYDLGRGPAGQGRTPIGLPVANCRVHLLDPHLAQVPPGVPGEVAIGGPGLARGYFDDPRRTALSFVPDPFGAAAGEPGGRLYRTGDRARRRADGNLIFLGRSDHQVKLRGVRVELAEIDQALCQHPAVRTAVAVVRPDPGGEKQLVAYVVARQGHGVSGGGSAEAGAGLSGAGDPGGELADWREFLLQRLPSAMLPAALVVLAALPLTAGGKVDRRALPEPDWRQAHEAHRFVPPRNQVEALLAGIWAELLGRGPVSVEDDFLGSGGHSLLAAQVVSRVRQLCGVELPLRALFEARTVRGLAEQVEAATGAGGAPPPIVAQPRGATAPLSFAQQRLWFLEQFQPGTALFNMPGAVRLSGPLRYPLLRRALDQIVARHEVLRTTFVTVDGQPVQAIAAAAAPGPEPQQPLPVVDLTALPEGGRDALLRRLIAAEARRPFDLAAGTRAEAGAGGPPRSAGRAQASAGGPSRPAGLLRTSLLRLGPAEHVALLTFHHTVADGWSLSVFLRELAALVGAWSAGHPSPLAPLPFQYADFAIWQRQWLQGQALAGELGYWRQQLAGVPQLLELPTDRPRPVEQSFRGSSRQLTLDAPVVAALTAWGQHRGGTLFMTLLAGFAALLGRLAGQTDVVIGSPIAGRDRRELEGLIGLFVNTLALRVDLAQQPDGDLLLDRIRRMALGAYTHSHVPFERLVDELSPARSGSHAPIAQVALVLQNLPPAPLRLPGLAMEPLAAASDTAKVDLTLSLTEVEGTLTGALEWAADLFDGTTIDRLAGHLAVVLAALAAHPERRVSDLPLLTAGERHQLVHEWNDTAAAAGGAGGTAWRGRCLHELFEEQAERTPGALAAASGVGGAGGASLTYAELDRRANQVARFLMARGVGPEVRVGLCMERSPLLLTAILGIWKAGGAYLPLDPAQPRERLAGLAAEVALVVTETRWRERLPAAAAAVELDAVQRQLDGVDGRRPAVRMAAANLAYVLYTSGSTGAPKGIMVSHRGLVHYLTWAVEAYQMRLGGGAPVTSPLAFDLTVTALLAPLLAGRCVELRGGGGEGGDDGFEALRSVLGGGGVDGVGGVGDIADYSLVKLTPAHLELLRQDPAGWDLRARVRVLILGGDALQGETLDLWRTRSPATRVINEYGPTETVVGCCVYEVPAGAAAAGPVPIGRPIPNMRAYVLDANLLPLPVGVPGHLHLAGAGLARGYHGLPGLTADRFIPDPFAAAPGGERLYRTGDLVRALPDGRLDFQGRIDHQVKVRGFRIELGEIESALAAHPGVLAAAVAAPAGAAGQRRLVAFWVPRPADAAVAADTLAPGDPAAAAQLQLTPAALRAFLGGRLPEYMVPASFVALAALPQTPNGKLDRRALLARAAAGEGERSGAAALLSGGVGGAGAGGGDAAAARALTPVEATLAAVWAEVLRRPDVALHDNFFELGGDSILSLQVVAKARQAGLLLRSRDLFQYQTVAQLAVVAVEEAAQAAGGAVAETGDGPLTPIQHWFFSLGLTDPHHFNQALMVDVRPAVTPRGLRQALSRVAARHPALHSRFAHEAELGWRQVAVPAPAAGVALPIVDLSALPAARRAAAVEAAAGSLQQSLDVERGPLFRLALFALGDAGRRLFLVFHHLVIDVVSWRILLADLEAAYQAYDGGNEPALPPELTSPRRWAAQLAAHAREAAVAAELDYWLDGARAGVRPLPRDRAAATNGMSEASVVLVDLDGDETRALLETLPATHHVAIQDVLLTALAQVLAGWQRETRLLVDLEGHGREELFAGVDTARTVGWLTTLYPVLLQLDGGDTRRPLDQLRAIKEQLRAVPRGGIGYGLLRYLGTPEQRQALDRLPAAEVVFNYLGQLDRGLPESRFFGLAGESGGAPRSARQQRNHLLEINGGVFAGCLRLIWTYSAGAHDRATIEALVDRFRAALRSLIEQGTRQEAASFTPSDFPEARLGQKDLDMLIARIGKRPPAARTGRPKSV